MNVHVPLKMAAWMASNCKSSSRREAYVAELRRHLAGGVSVFGDCGGRPCDDECVEDAVEAGHKYEIVPEWCSIK